MMIFNINILFYSFLSLVLKKGEVIRELKTYHNISTEYER
jgi:hypothetical protein